MQDIQLFRSLVSNQNGTPVTTSNKIANVFGKQHKNVLRAIDKLDCSAEFSRLNFELCYEINDLQNGSSPEKSGHVIFHTPNDCAKLRSQLKSDAGRIYCGFFVNIACNYTL